MQMLYDSDTFVVVHIDLNAVDGGEVQYRNSIARHGFEIVDKKANKEVFLDGSWAEAFQRQISAWQINTPTQEECEAVLLSYAGLAQIPLVMH